MIAHSQQAEPKPILYRLTRAVVKVAMTVFFRKIELRHGKYVPERGPVVFVANHPNSVMDALVMGVVTRRKVNYVGHAGLFSNKLKSWFLRSTGVIPVYRREDAPDKMGQNVAMFEACYQALENGETIGIFPEGTSDMVRKVKKVKTGAARMVLEAERRNGYKLGLTLLPVGLYFFSRSRFRSRVLVNVGVPIKLSDFFEMNEEDNVAAVQALTAEIQRNLQKTTVNIEHEELDTFVRDIEHLYREELQAETFGSNKTSRATVAEFFLTQKIADCVEHFYRVEREKVQRIQDNLATYKRKLSRLHLKDAMLKEKATFAELLKRSVASFAPAVVGAPLALYGIINNIIPYSLTEFLVKKTVDDRTKILLTLLFGGTGIFVVFYTLQFLFIAFLTSKIFALIYILSVPLVGLFALNYLKMVQEQRERISLFFFLFSKPQMLEKIRNERDTLISQLNQVRDEYLAIWSSRAQPPGDSGTSAE
ncbi:MAG: lysophospholipid acyltransferase family protein [bacterium]